MGLAASFAHARRAQDECLDVVLGEMAALTREVAQLRREVDALKAERTRRRRRSTRAGRRTSGAGRRTSRPATFPGGEGGSRHARRARPAETATGPSPDRIRRVRPFPENEDTSDVPVRIDAAGWRGDGTDRSHLWPMCKTGEDDIYIMTTIQEAMNDAGYWAGEEDEADMYFGPSTQDALCYFQAGAGSRRRASWTPTRGRRCWARNDSDGDPSRAASDSTRRRRRSRARGPASSAALAAMEWSEVSRRS